MTTTPKTPLPEGVAATTGGKFDRDAGLTYFIAGSIGNFIAGSGARRKEGDEQVLVTHPNLLIAVNEVRSRKDFDLLDRLCDERRVLLDSGIFNLAMTHARKHNTSHDVGLSMPPEDIDGFDELWEQYGSVATHFAGRLWGVIELDQGGVANKPRTRARIEDEFGLTPMPVYHPLLDGWDYYDQLAQGYDRICFGNLVKAAAPVRLRLIHAASERGRAYPYLWTHLLGVTPNENVLGLPMRGSCDSSSWLTSQRWMPSWRGSSMAKMITNYPPSMWYAQNEGWRSSALNDVTAHALQLTLDAMQEDTHPWLSPSNR